MKCKDCPILKYDGETYTCPALMYQGVINMYTEVDCRGMEWYPKFLRDQIDTLIYNIRQLDEILCELRGMLRTYKNADGYLKLVADDLESVYNKYANKNDLLGKESLRLQEELRRVEENVKAEKVSQERVHSTVAEQQANLSSWI